MDTQHRFTVSVFGRNGAWVLPGIAWACYVKTAAGSQWEPTTSLFEACDFKSGVEAEAAAMALAKAYPAMGFDVSYPSRYAYTGESN